MVGYSPWGHKESDTTEWLHFLFHFLSLKKGSINHEKILNIINSSISLTSEFPVRVYLACKDQCVIQTKADSWGLVPQGSLPKSVPCDPQTQNSGHQSIIHSFCHHSTIYWVPAICLVLVALCWIRQMDFHSFGFTFWGGRGREAVIIKSQWFSNFNSHQNHLEGLYNYKSLDPTPRMSNSVGLE